MHSDPCFVFWTRVLDDLDDPPPEVAAAGHDRCIIQIKPENVDAWLDLDPDDLEAMDRILDDRSQAFYEQRQTKGSPRGQVHLIPFFYSLITG